MSNRRFKQLAPVDASAAGAAMMPGPGINANLSENESSKLPQIGTKNPAKFDINQRPHALDFAFLSPGYQRVGAPKNDIDPDILLMASHLPEDDEKSLISLFSSASVVNEETSSMGSSRKCRSYVGIKYGEFKKDPLTKVGAMLRTSKNRVQQ